MWYFTEFSVALSGLLFVTRRLVLRLPLASSFSLLGSFWLSLALTWSLCGSLRPSWLFWALSGSHLLTRHLLGSLTGSCKAALFKALVAVMHFGGLLRKRGWSQINSMIHHCFGAKQLNTILFCRQTKNTVGFFAKCSNTHYISRQIA